MALKPPSTPAGAPDFGGSERVLRGRLARRMMLLFLSSAILPISILAALSYRHVVESLEEQTKRRLHQQTKAVAMSVVERLLFLETSLEMVSQRLGRQDAPPVRLSGDRLLLREFEWLAAATAEGQRAIIGRPGEPPPLDERERAHLATGRTVIRRSDSATMAELLVVRSLQPDDLARGWLWGKVEPTYLWDVGTQGTLPPRTELSVIDESGGYLIRSAGIPDELAGRLSRLAASPGPRQFEWEGGGESYLASYWQIPMATNYMAGSWTVALSQRRSDALAPVALFRRNFPLFLGLTLLSVAFFSLRQIRRSLQPLEELGSGTRRVAAGDFGGRVRVESGDELQELGQAFNAMTERLGWQFAELRTIAAVGRSVVTEGETAPVIRTFLEGAGRVIACDRVELWLPLGATGAARRFVAVRPMAEGPGEPASLEEQEVAELESPEEQTRRLASDGYASSVHAELAADNRRIGHLIVASRAGSAFDAEAQARLSELADLLALALRHLGLRAELSGERQRLQSLVEQLPNGVLLLDGERRIVLANRLARSYLPDLATCEPGEALQDLGGLSLEELAADGGKATWRELSVEGAEKRVFMVAATPLSASGEGALLLVLREVTLERATEERLRRQERLASVGQLAAGMAHDLNNMLQGIMLSANLLDVGAEGAGRSMPLETILTQGRRASELIRQVLDFSRRSSSSARPLELRGVVQEMVQLLSRTLTPNVTIALETGAEGSTVMADPTQMQQVLMNLALNARDAMPEGGELNIGLQRVRLVGEEVPLPEMSPGVWLVLSVADTGTGIPEEIRDRIFDPFFTHKASGQGTGLGLAQVYGIVKQHGGHVDFESRVGIGTVFKVYLPAAEGPVEEPAMAGGPAPVGHRQQVLVVEDDPAVLDLVDLALQSLGYRTLTAFDGREALELYRQHQESVALVLSDVVMPVMGGKELARRLYREDPALPIILMSGYAGAGGQDLTSKCLSKPFSRDELAEALSEALGPRESAADPA